ncbi:MAG: hypothetical protein AB1486_23650 [Planctomycetota bacterium]
MRAGPLAILLAAAASRGLAQGVDVLTLDVSPPAVEVGERVRIALVAPEGASLSSLPRSLALAGLVVIGYEDVHQHGRPARLYDAVACEPGSYEVGPFEVDLERRDGGPQRMSSGRQTLVIRSVVGSGGRAEVQPLLGPVTQPETSRWGDVILVLAAFAAGSVLALMLRRSRMSQPRAEPSSSETADVAELLGWLEEEVPAGDSERRQFYARVAEAMRLFLEVRLAVSCRRLTTHEILSLVRARGALDQERRELLTRVFAATDRGQFARRGTERAEGRMAVQEARELMRRSPP